MWSQVPFWFGKSQILHDVSMKLCKWQFIILLPPSSRAHKTAAVRHTSQITCTTSPQLLLKDFQNCTLLPAVTDQISQLAHTAKPLAKFCLRTHFPKGNRWFYSNKKRRNFHSPMSTSQSSALLSSVVSPWAQTASLGASRELTLASVSPELTLATVASV